MKPVPACRATPIFAVMTADLMEQIRHYCAYQERCHSEVRKKLYDLSFSGADMEEVMGTLIEEDFLNEERFARSYCRGKFRLKHWGRQKIINHLRQKQVSEYCIHKGLEEIGEEDYERVFQDLFQKKWRSLSTEKNHWIKKKKTRDYLLAKGFEPELIYEQFKKN